MLLYRNRLKKLSQQSQYRVIKASSLTRVGVEPSLLKVFAYSPPWFQISYLYALFRGHY